MVKYHGHLIKPNIIKMTMRLDRRSLLCRRNTLRCNQQKKRFKQCFFKYFIARWEILFSKNSYYRGTNQLIYYANQLTGFYVVVFTKRYFL